jgi:hypothetical protein
MLTICYGVFSLILCGSIVGTVHAQLEENAILFFKIGKSFHEKGKYLEAIIIMIRL